MSNYFNDNLKLNSIAQVEALVKAEKQRVLDSLGCRRDEASELWICQFDLPAGSIEAVTELEARAKALSYISKYFRELLLERVTEFFASLEC